MWNFLDLAAQLGGVSRTFMALFALILLPFADHSFICHAISTLYVLKQKDDLLLFEEENEIKKKI